MDRGDEDVFRCFNLQRRVTVEQDEERNESILWWLFYSTELSGAGYKERVSYCCRRVMARVQVSPSVTESVFFLNQILNLIPIHITSSA